MRRRKNTTAQQDEIDDAIQSIESEELDQDSSPPTYEINVFPADYPLETLVEKLREKEINIPPFQRKFVWKQKQSSRLIESFLLGLPVPPIYLYVDKADNKLLVVDGQQRLRSISYFWSGHFGEEENGKRPVFHLTGLSEKSPFLDKTFDDLKETNPAAHRKLKGATLRSYIIKQLTPGDDTSIYHIFERLNTGGTPLTGQEIRNCIYHGPFNELLHELNKGEDWRELFGKDEPDKRQRDIELILRFFALHYASSKYEKPMKDFLSKFMNRNRHANSENLQEFRDLFTNTSATIKDVLGPKPFRLEKGLNVAIFDSTYTAFANQKKIPTDIKTRFAKLLKDGAYKKLVTASTTDEEAVATRLLKARKRLFGTAH